MFKELFFRYLKVKRNVSDSSANQYINSINTINKFLMANYFSINDLFSLNSIEELDSVKNYLDHNEEFIKKNATGHNIYRAAFNHYYRFICEEQEFSSLDIRQMDIPVAIPETTNTTVHGWNRNQIIKRQAIIAANYTCENNSEHSTFISKMTRKPYMEGHHIIPMKFQERFSTSIDVYANVVCLCPNCHRLMHYGTDIDRKIVSEKLFENRSERLLKSGIIISKNDFLEMVI